MQEITRNKITSILYLLEKETKMNCHRIERIKSTIVTRYSVKHLINKFNPDDFNHRASVQLQEIKKKKR